MGKPSGSMAVYLLPGAKQLQAAPDRADGKRDQHPHRTAAGTRPARASARRPNRRRRGASRPALSPAGTVTGSAPGRTQLAAATARIGVAKADYFRRVFLTGAIGVGGLVLNGQNARPSGPLSHPTVGDGAHLQLWAGRRRGRPPALVPRRPCCSISRRSDRPPGRFGCAAEYRKRREARAQQEALTVAARETTRLANTRYTDGVTPYLEVLDSERQLFDAELGLVGSSATRCGGGPPLQSARRRLAVVTCSGLMIVRSTPER